MANLLGDVGLASKSTDAPIIEFLPRGRVAPLTKMVLASGSQVGEFDGGAYYAGGAPCPTGRQVKGSYIHRPLDISGTEPQERVSGCHIYGGMLQNRHFGHFMAESLTRIWPVHYFGGQFRSVVFYLRSPGRPVAGFVQKVIEALVPGVEIRFAERLTEFEMLAVPSLIGNPGQGMIYGHPVIRSMLENARRDRRKGPSKVYVSRSALTSNEGSLLLERQIEQNLAAEGYEIVHPQSLSISEQLDIYNAAERLIFAEGSALHLYALMARPEQRVFVIWRRKRTGTFDWQIRSFGGAPLQGLPCIRRMWVPGEGYGAGVRAQAELDFPALCQQLVAGGFISGSHWENPTEKQVADDLARLQELTTEAFIERPAP